MKLKLPVLVINMKEYEQALGEGALDIARAAKNVKEKHDVSILISPPPLIFSEIADIVPTVSQHVDPVESGSHTGAVLAEEIKKMNGVGSLINHSEKRIPYEDIKKSIDLCNKYDLISIVCAQDSEEAKKLAIYGPDFIAVEPPELIGGDISVSTAKPEVITETVEKVKNISPQTEVLCGAGVKTAEDVKKSLELGAKGVLVASGIVKADDIEGSIEKLVEGML
jgi:triosephosphate isomerase